MRRVLHRFLVALSIVSQAACVPEHVPTAYLLFLDLTGSVSKAQGAAWGSSIDVVLRRLTFGDTVAVYPITDRTLDAAPLFRARIANEGVSLEDLAAARASLQQVRAEAAATVAAAFASPARARRTDVFAVVDRVAAATRGSDMPTEVFIFSDFLDTAAPDLIDMEQSPLQMETLSTLITKVQQRHGWAPDMLRGATIAGVLNGVSSGGRSPVNDRRVLGAFWGALFEAVGGCLAQFDTTVRLQSAGGLHAANTCNS
jgi:hypothetical protein